MSALVPVWHAPHYRTRSEMWLCVAREINNRTLEAIEQGGSLRPGIVHLPMGYMAVHAFRVPKRPAP